MKIAGTWGSAALASLVFVSPVQAADLSMTHYYQSTSYYCGPAEGKMAIKYITGKVYLQSTLARAMGTVYRSGTGLSDVVRVVRAYSGVGYYVTNVWNRNLRSAVVTNIDRKRPVLANFNGRYLAYWRYHYVKHHSPIKGYTSGGYYVHDTAKGPNRWASNTQMYNAIRYHRGVYGVRY